MTGGVHADDIIIGKVAGVADGDTITVLETTPNTKSDCMESIRPLDLLLKEKLARHRLALGHMAVLASVSAGMNINAVVYRMA